MLPSCPTLSLRVALFATLSAASPAIAGPQGLEAHGAAGAAVPGERVDPATIPAGYVESMQAVVEREALRPRVPGQVRKARGEDHGRWEVPSRRGTRRAHSGERYATNRWGDTRMGVGFDQPLDVVGVWVAGQADPAVWTDSLTVVGYREGVEVGRTPAFTEIGDAYTWFSIELEGVDRIEWIAGATYEGAGFYAIDDLTLRDASRETVVTFDELPWRFSLTGSRHAGLTWEEGTGDFEEVRIVPAPKTPPGVQSDESAGADESSSTHALGGGGTLPTLTTNFVGPRLGDNGAGWLPPDTCGAVGTDHYVSVVNQHMSVYDKQTGARLISTSLQSFFNTGGSAGDPRIAYDHTTDRWIVIASNFTSGTPYGVFFAFSTSSDATGSWFKSFIPFDGGSDAGNWVDYQTLGYDANGIYMAAYMVGGNFRMSLFAVDKAPLLDAVPSIGTVSAWRQLPWEGAIQPCVSYGPAAGEYVVSQRNSSQLRIRRIDGPLSSPTMTNVGFVNIPNAPNPPSAPAQGSTVNLSTVGPRLMNAVYRNGSVWTAHTIGRGGRAACRWYELDPVTLTTAQVGNVEDPVRHYFFPAISVNAAGDVALGFSASSPNMFAGAWYTGRLAGDPPGEMAPPVSMKDGLNAYNQASSGTNRWGDYSLTNVDPVDDHSIWTIQEYARNNNNWGTWIGKLEFPEVCSETSINYCASTVNSSGLAAIAGTFGSQSITDNNFELFVDQAATQKFGIFYYGPNQIQTAFGDGFRCVGGQTNRLPIVQTDSFGFVSFALDLQNAPGIAPDATQNFQFWFRDPMGPGGNGFNLSDGVSVTFCP